MWCVYDIPEKTRSVCVAPPFVDDHTRRGAALLFRFQPP